MYDRFYMTMNKGGDIMKKFILTILIFLFFPIFLGQSIMAQTDFKNQQQVIVTTDKRMYKQGEPIKITLKNNSEDIIFSHISSGTPVFAIEYVEKRAPSGWEKFFAQKQNVKWDIDGPGKLEPDCSETLEWDPFLYSQNSNEPMQANPGLYRIAIIYQIRNSSLSEDWEWKIIYSNEFTIE